MHLWTFQTTKATEVLVETGELIIPWSYYSPTSNWNAPYQWMVQQMENQGISCYGNAPIWAWHSCNTYQQGPILGDAILLFGGADNATHIQTIELECPDELVLLSNYNTWNELLDKLLPPPLITTPITTTEMKQLFTILPQKIKMGEAIQATLPYLKKEWVSSIRKLPFETGDEIFDENTLV